MGNFRMKGMSGCMLNLNEYAGPLNREMSCKKKTTNVEDWRKKFRAKLDKDTNERTNDYFDAQKSQSSRPCFLCGMKKKGKFERVKIGKNKHMICQECYLKHLECVDKTGEIPLKGVSEMVKKKKEKAGKTPRVCGCGCGAMTKGGEFCIGHDSKHKKNLKEAFLKGSAKAKKELKDRGWMKLVMKGKTPSVSKNKTPNTSKGKTEGSKKKGEKSKKGSKKKGEKDKKEASKKTEKKEVSK